MESYLPEATWFLWEDNQDSRSTMLYRTAWSHNIAWMQRRLPRCINSPRRRGFIPRYRRRRKKIKDLRDCMGQTHSLKKNFFY